MKRLLALAAFFILSSLPSLAAWSRVQRVVNYCGTTATSCSTTIAQPTAGNLLLAVAFYNNSGITISSASGAGTWVHPAGCTTSLASGQIIDMAYSLSSTGSGTSVTVNFSSTGAGFADLWVLEYTGGTGSYSFDLCGTGSNTSSTSINGGSITTTGANDLAVAVATASANISSQTSIAVSPSPWATPTTLINGQEIAGNALGFAATTTQAVFANGASVNSAGVTIAFKDSTAAGGAFKPRLVTPIIISYLSGLLGCWR